MKLVRQWNGGSAPGPWRPDGLVCTLVHHPPAVGHWPSHLSHLQRRKAALFRDWTDELPCMGSDGGDPGGLLLKVGPASLKSCSRRPVRCVSGEGEHSGEIEANRISGTVQGLALWASPCPLGKSLLEVHLLKLQASRLAPLLPRTNRSSSRLLPRWVL